MNETSPTTYAEEIIQRVVAGIDGRVAIEAADVNILAWAVARAGDGNHLEIGTLFGGSAIITALVKAELGLKGRVTCLDPLDGYYLGTPFACPVDPVCTKPITAERVRKNAEAFGVELEIIAKKSQPFPEELMDRRFVSAYIDGDHWGDGPMLDWLNVKARTDRIVVFDNNDAKHPAVQKAVEEAIKDPAWKLIFLGGISAVLERCDGH